MIDHIQGHIIQNPKNEEMKNNQNFGGETNKFQGHCSSVGKSLGCHMVVVEKPSNKVRK